MKITLISKSSKRIGPFWVIKSNPLSKLIDSKSSFP
jgi:hypothetical protein